MTSLCALVTVVAVFYIATKSVNAKGAGTDISRLFASKDVKQPSVAKRHDDRKTGCGCKNYNCGCCAHLEVEKIGLNNTACTNVTYLPDQYGMSFTISVDGVVYFNRTVSLKNPPPIFCLAIPGLKKYASLCVQFYNLTVKSSQFSGCIRIKAELEGLVVDEFKIGCFKIPPGRLKAALIQEHYKEVQVTKQGLSGQFTKYSTTGCSCLYYDCGCCMDLALKLDAAKPKDTVCANMTFLPKTSEVLMTLIVDKVIYYKKTVPVRNPPPVCFHLPVLSSLDLCVQFYSLDIKDAKLTGCVHLLSEFDGKVVDSFDLGCFSFPAGVSQQSSKSLLTKKDGHPTRLENLLFVAYEEAKKKRLFNNF